MYGIDGRQSRVLGFDLSRRLPINYNGDISLSLFVCLAVQDGKIANYTFSPLRAEFSESVVFEKAGESPHFREFLLYVHY